MDPLLLLKAFALGIVEGLTEFLPISSTGHLILFGKWIGYHNPTFDIVIQLGAILAVVVMYWRDLYERTRDAWRGGSNMRTIATVLIAFMPAAILGLLVHKQIKTLLFGPVPVALALIVGGVLMIWLEHRQHRAAVTRLDDVTPRHALQIGVAQCLALWPGFSRAAASIFGGLLSGLDRTTATIFSFYLAIPTMLGATVVGLAGDTTLTTADIPVYAVGFLTAFVTAWIVIKAMLGYIAKHTFTAFGYYRIALAIVVLWVHR